jgi:hypothetical protein
VKTQVVAVPNKIINSYQVALQANYYYPFLSTMTVETMEDDNNSTETSTPTTSAHSPSRTEKTTITVESSLETITDILAVKFQIAV